MQKNFSEKERKLVPRFRRKNANKNLVDLDDEEAQALIEKDLKSDFTWTSDTNQEITFQFDSHQHENNSQQISIDDQINNQLIYDIDNNNEQLWNINTQHNENDFIQWTHDQQHQQIFLNVQNIQDQQQQWTLHDLNERSIQFHLNNQDNQQYKLDTINNKQQTDFIKGEEFRHQV
jgi:hypothetical protein